MYKLNCIYLILLLIAFNCFCSIRVRVWASVGSLGDYMSKVSIIDSFSLFFLFLLALNVCCSFFSIWVCFNFSCFCLFRVLIWNIGFLFYFICKILVVNFYKINNLIIFLFWWGFFLGIVFCFVVIFEWFRLLDFLLCIYFSVC